MSFEMKENKLRLSCAKLWSAKWSKQKTECIKVIAVLWNYCWCLKIYVPAKIFCKLFHNFLETKIFWYFFGNFLFCFVTIGWSFDEQKWRFYGNWELNCTTFIIVFTNGFNGQAVAMPQSKRHFNWFFDIFVFDSF